MSESEIELSPLVVEMREYVEGHRPYPTTPARRHHFVPAFSLAEFATPPGNRKGFLFQLDLGSVEVARSRPHDAAFELEMYSYEDTQGEQSNSIEVFFSRVEKHAAPALARLCSDPAALTPADRQTIAYYLVCQESRTPGGLERRERLRQVQFEVQSAIDLSTNAGFRERFGSDLPQSAETDGGEAIRGHMLRQLLAGAVTYQQPRVGALRQLVDDAHEMAATVYALDWTILTSDDAEFITSDRPVSMVDLEPEVPWSGNAWTSSQHALTFYPLSPSRGLLMRPGDCRLDADIIDDQTVHAFNLMTYGWARQRIFGRSEAAVQTVRERAEQSPDDLPTPRSPKQVVLTPIEFVTPRVRDMYAARGWPPELLINRPEGPRPMGYVVVDPDDPPGTAARAVTDLIAGFSETPPGL